MRRIHRVVAALVVMLGLTAAWAACGNKKDAGSGGGSGEAKVGSAGSGSPAPVTCPPGNAIKDGACVVVVTPAKIQAVVVQQSRLDELGKLLDQADTVGAPIELFGGIRQLEPWKALKAKSDRIAAIDAVADSLDQAVKTLRGFKGSVGEASGRLGNLKGELDRLMSEPGNARRIEEVRTQVSSQLRAAIEPFSTQVASTIQNAIVPLSTQLTNLFDVVTTGCLLGKASGGDKMKDLCTQAKAAFLKALAYLDDVKARPAKLFNDVTSQLETELEPLIDAETRKLLDAAQTKVNEALKLPTAEAGSAGSGSNGSGAAAGSSH